MVFKFLSKGKKSEYFLEAPSDTNGATATPAAKVAEAKKAVEKTLAEAQKSAEAKVDQLQETVAKVADAVEDKVAAVTESKSEPTKSTAKTKKMKTAKAAKPEAKPITATVKAAPKAEPVKNFATNFLMPNSATPRRRPGPSMDAFRSMAKDVTPRR